MLIVGLVIQISMIIWMINMNFKEFLMIKEGTSMGSKSMLYPLGYNGIGLYPLSYYMPYSADALVYISQDNRIFHNGDGTPHSIKHIPGRPSFSPTKNPNNGENKPFSIKHIPR